MSAPICKRCKFRCLTINEDSGATGICLGCRDLEMDDMAVQRYNAGTARDWRHEFGLAMLTLSILFFFCVVRASKPVVTPEPIVVGSEVTR